MLFFSLRQYYFMKDMYNTCFKIPMLIGKVYNSFHKPSRITHSPFLNRTRHIFKDVKHTALYFADENLKNRGAIGLEVSNFKSFNLIFNWVHFHYSSTHLMRWQVKIRKYTCTPNGEP